VLLGEPHALQSLDVGFLQRHPSGLRLRLRVLLWLLLFLHHSLPFGRAVGSGGCSRLPLDRAASEGTCGFPASGRKRFVGGGDESPNATLFRLPLRSSGCRRFRLCHSLLGYLFLDLRKFLLVPVVLGRWVHQAPLHGLVDIPVVRLEGPARVLHGETHALKHCDIRLLLLSPRLLLLPPLFLLALHLLQPPLHLDLALLLPELQCLELPLRLQRGLLLVRERDILPLAGEPHATALRDRHRRLGKGVQRVVQQQLCLLHSDAESRGKVGEVPLHEGRKIRPGVLQVEPHAAERGDRGHPPLLHVLHRGGRREDRRSAGEAQQAPDVLGRRRWCSRREAAALGLGGGKVCGLAWLHAREQVRAARIFGLLESLYEPGQARGGAPPSDPDDAPAHLQTMLPLERWVGLGDRTAAA